MDAVRLPSGTAVLPADPMSDADWAARCAAWELTGGGADAGGDAGELAALGADALGADADALVGVLGGGRLVPEDALSSGPAGLTRQVLAQIVAEADAAQAGRDRLAAAADAAGVPSAVAGAARRGPEWSGDLEPGVYAGAAAGLAHGGCWDSARPSAVLLAAVEDAAGPRFGFDGASDDELVGAVCAADRLSSLAAALKAAAAAAFLRLRPAGPRQPGAPWDEHAPAELALALASGKRQAEDLAETADQLTGRLPGTFAALADGTLSEDKARIIVHGTTVLDSAGQAHEAEQEVLGRAGLLTPSGLAAAVRRTVTRIDPEAAARRRELAARDRRVEVRPEESGNSMLAVRELGPEVAAAIDAQLTARARDLQTAGIGQDTGDRRVLALIEKFGLVSFDHEVPVTAVSIPAKLNLTIPLRTLQRDADLPGELASHGPIDPDLAVRLGQAALRHRGSKVTVTAVGPDGVMAGFGLARPATRAERDWYERTRGDPPPGRGNGPPGRGSGTAPELIRYRGSAKEQLDSGGPWGTWLLDPGNGMPVQAVRIGSIGEMPCQHRLSTPAHDPGTELEQAMRLRYRECVSPVCRRPATQCDTEHNVPHATSGRTCICGINPTCRHDHRLKQKPGWHVIQHPDGRIEWHAPTGRTATTRPHQYLA